MSIKDIFKRTKKEKADIEFDQNKNVITIGTPGSGRAYGFCRPRNNVVILGSAGSGKTFIMKHNISKALQIDNTEIIVLNFDRDYAEFATALGGEVIQVRPETPIASDNRFVVCDLSWISHDLVSGTSEMTLEYIKGRMEINHENGKETHIYIDDFWPVMESETLFSIWSSAWQYDARITIATQNTRNVCLAESCKTWLANAHETIVLKQCADDRMVLASLFDLSEEKVNTLAYPKPGQGLFFVGTARIPYEFKI